VSVRQQLGPPNGLTRKVSGPDTVLPLNVPLMPTVTPVRHVAFPQLKLLLVIEHPGVIVVVSSPVVPPH